MADNTLKNLLEISKRSSNIVKEGATSNNTVDRSNIITRSNYDTKIAEFDEAIFGKYNPQEVKGYSADAEADRIRNNEYKPRKDITNPILLEVMNNPHNLDIDFATGAANPKMKQLTEKLQAKNFGGIEKAAQITKVLEDSDKQNVVKENKQVSSTIDYSIIKTIVESVIDEKLKEYSHQIINENKMVANNKTSMIMLGENFTFVDGDGNMYKCGDMKYVGKARINKK